MMIIQLACMLLAPNNAAEFLGIGYLPGGMYSAAFSISIDGEWCGGRANVDLRTSFPIVWNRIEGLGVIKELGFEESGNALGIAVGGEIACGTANLKGFYYHEGSFTIIPGDGFSTQQAFDLTADGSIVVGIGGTGAGWTWRPGELAQPIVPPVNWKIGGSAEAISPDGSVIAGYARNPQDKTESYRLFADLPFEAIGYPPSADPGSRARDCSFDGSVVVGDANGSQSFRWSEEQGMQSIGFNLYCYAVSGDGEVMVGMELDFDLGEYVAVLWINGVKHNLRDYLIASGATGVFPYLKAAYDVSADGTMICGAGRNDQGLGEGFWCRIPRTLGPHSIRVNIQKPVFGSISGGDRRSSFKSDDERLEITNGIVPSNSLSPVTWEIEGTAARLTPSKLEFTLEAQVSRSGLSQTIDLWNHQTQTWQTVDTRAATQTDSTVTIERTTDATQFVRPQDGKVKARIRYKATAPGASSTWKARIDHARWTAHP